MRRRGGYAHRDRNRGGGTRMRRGSCGRRPGVGFVRLPS